MPPRGDAAGASSSEHPRPGQISALLEELVRAPASGAAAGWKRGLQPGMVVGRYELVREVGRGGFGVVYEARDRELGRTVAFKALSPRARPEVAGEVLLREAEAAALCSHSNIVTLHDLGRDEQGPYLILEFLRGQSLAARLARGSVAAPEALRVAVEVAKGLAHAHAHGVIRRAVVRSRSYSLAADEDWTFVQDVSIREGPVPKQADGSMTLLLSPLEKPTWKNLLERFSGKLSGLSEINEGLRYCHLPKGTLPRE